MDSLAAIINAVNSVKVDPTIASSAKVTMVQTNGKNINIIPDEATFGVDIRSSTNDEMNTLMTKINEAVVSAGRANGAEVTLETVASMGAAVPNSLMESIVQEAISEVLGNEGTYPPQITPGGEDFHFYSIERPNIKATMIGLGCDLSPGLHHPMMSFNLDALQIGVRILSLSTIKLFLCNHSSINNIL